MAAPAIITGNVVVGYAIMWRAVADTARPTTVYGGDLGASVVAWSYVGATEEGVTWAKSTDVQDHFVEESSISVFSTPGTGRFAFTGALAETTMENLKFCLGGGTLTGTVGAQTLTPSETLDQYAIVLDTVAPGSTIRRVYVPRVRIVSQLEVANRRSEQKQLFNFEAVANCAMSEIRIVTAAIS